MKLFSSVKVALNTMSKKKYIQLPKHHLSYSQVSLWKSDPIRYKQIYFDHRDEMKLSNHGQEYGKVVADALEKGVETGDLLTDSAMLLLPKYDVADQPIEVDVKTKDGWLCLIAKPDSFNSETHEFLEFKTGKHAWSQKKAQNHLQMIFYAIVIWQKYGVQLPGAKLAWIETEAVGDRISPTGRVETFDVTFTSTQYLETLAEIVKVAKEIEIAWASHITNPEYEKF